MEGKISVKMKSYQSKYYEQYYPHRSTHTWASNLVKQLLLLTHHLWTYRNEVVHKRDKCGLLLKDASTLQHQIKAQLALDDIYILEEDRQLVAYGESTISS